MFFLLIQSIKVSPNLALSPIKVVLEQKSRDNGSKEVDALEEKLEAKVGSLKATIDERFNIVQQQFSPLEAMLLKLTELHLNPPLATLMGGNGVTGERSGGTEPIVDGSTKGRGLKTTSLAQPGGTGHIKFRGEEVGPRESRLEGAFSGVKGGRRSWVVARGNGSEDYVAERGG